MEGAAVNAPGRTDALRSDIAVRAISIVALAATVAYVGWRLTTLTTNAWLSIPLFVVELWGALHLALLVMQGWGGTATPTSSMPPSATVTTIVTATFHSPEELERTLIGCQAMETDGPVVVAVRDGRDDLLEVCDGFDVHRLSGTGNHVDLFWLAVEATGAPLAAWLEAGQVPMHDFVTELAGGLDHGVAVVQASIGQLNKDSLAHIEGGRDEHAFRQKVAFPGMSRRGTAPWFGGGSLIRAHAIRETGGIDREDQAALQRGLVRLHAEGWASRYVSRKLVRDNAPDSMEAYLHRRRRAAIETLRVFRTPDSALTKSGLGLAERAAHVALALAFTAGARQLALTAVLITTLATGTMPVGDDAVLWSALWIPAFATGVLARWALARGVMRIGDWTKQGWRTVGADLSAFADVLGLTKRPRAFSDNATSGVKVLGDMRLATATLILLDLALVLRGLTLFWPRMLPRFSATGRVMALLIGLVVVIGIVDVLQVVVRRRQRRAQYRLTTRFIGYIDGRRGDVIDLAPSGAGIYIALDSGVEVGDEVTVEMAVPLSDSREVITTSATVRSLVPMDDRLRVGVSFGELSREVRAVLVQYCAIDHHRAGGESHNTNPGDFDLSRPRGRATRSLSGSAVMAGVVALFFGPAAVPALADVAAPATACLVTSTGEPLSGGEVRFRYDGSWHAVGTTGVDGCVVGDMPARKTRVSVTYGGVEQSQRQNLADNPTVTFATTPVTVSLTTSTGEPIAGAIAEYHAGGWQPIGTTGGDGTATIEMLASNRTFRITHDDIRNRRKQNVADDPVVTFATIPVTVSLTTSTGDPIEGALAEYHAAGWKAIGPTGADGTASTEMLASNRTFRVTHDDIRNSTKQDVSSDPVVTFATIPVTVALTTSVGDPIEGALAEYHAAGWKEIGPTGADGTVSTEMLASNRTFRVTHDGIRNRAKQDTRENATITFATKPVTVVLTDSTGAPIAGAMAEFHAGGWKEIGPTGEDGTVSTELLPSKRSFRVTHDDIHNRSRLDTGEIDTITFATIPVTVSVTTSTGDPIAGAVTEYHARGWKNLGTTGVDGTATVEMLASKRTFRVSLDGLRRSIRVTVPDQDVVFRTVPVFADEGVDVVSYRAGGWQDFVDGDEMLPTKVDFRTDDGTRTRVELTPDAPNYVPSGATSVTVVEENADPEPVATAEPSATPEPTATVSVPVDGEVTEEPTATPEPTEVPVDDTEEPTATPEPTEEPVDDTEEPTATPEPTDTEEPTATPEPTETEEPTATPEPTEEPVDDDAEPTPTPGFTIDIPEPTPTPGFTLELDIPEPTPTPGLTLDLATPTPAPEPTPTEAPTEPTATAAPTSTPVPTDDDDDADEDGGVIDAANRTVVLSPGVDWNATAGASTDQLEVRLTEPVVSNPDAGYEIAIENKSAAEVSAPLVVEIAVPRTSGLDLPVDSDWACDALNGTTVRCNHPGGLPGSSTSVLAFSADGDETAETATTETADDDIDDETAAPATESVLRSEGGSAAADTALAVGALALTGFVVFGARRLVTRKR